MATQTKLDKDREEFRIFVERFAHFMNLWTLYKDLLSGHYKPSVGSAKNYGATDALTDMQSTLMFVLYAFFYSLVEDSADGVNAFRVWRVRFPEEEAPIAVVEARVLPFRNDLRVFRNRLGFHGSRSRAHEAAGFDLFANHSGTAVLNAMRTSNLLVLRCWQRRTHGTECPKMCSEYASGSTESAKKLVNHKPWELGGNLGDN